MLPQTSSQPQLSVSQSQPAQPAAGELYNGLLQTIMTLILVT